MQLLTLRSIDLSREAFEEQRTRRKMRKRWKKKSIEKKQQKREEESRAMCYVQSQDLRSDIGA